MKAVAVLTLCLFALAAASADDCICTRELKEVCGSDGKTYSNNCMFECAAKKDDSLKIVKDGKCDAPCVCPALWAPICGSDGVTYDNECKLKCLANKNPGLKKVSEGACPSA